MDKKENLGMEENENFEGGFKIKFEDSDPENDIENTDSFEEESLAEDVEEEETIELNDFSKNGKHLAEKRGIAAWWANRKKWQKVTLITVTSLVLVIAIVLGVLLKTFDYNYNKITEEPEDLGFENVLDENIVNVALFGIDTRDPNSFKGLSDSIMILSLNTTTNQVKIISVMRDSLVPITTNNGKTSYSKINGAYAKGGPELAIKTLNKNFGLDISEYATVNFYGMADIIDAVGGVEAELTAGEVKKSDGTQHSINGCIDEICNHLGLDPNKYHIFKAGVHQLNGVQAVAYSRIRYVSNIWGTSNDYGRTDRQRHVMEQLFNKALTMEKSQYVTLAKSLIPCSETSLSYSEIMGLAFDILLESPTFAQTRVPQQDWQMTQPSGVGSVVYYDLDFAAEVIHAFIYDDILPEDYIAQNGVKKVDWYRNKFGYSTGGSGGSTGGNTDANTDVDIDDTDNSADGNTNGDTDSNSGQNGGGDSGGNTGGGNNGGTDESGNGNTGSGNNGNAGQDGNGNSGNTDGNTGGENTGGNTGSTDGNNNGNTGGNTGGNTNENPDVGTGGNTGGNTGGGTTGNTGGNTGGNTDGSNAGANTGGDSGNTNNTQDGNTNVTRRR